MIKGLDVEDLAWKEEAEGWLSKFEPESDESLRAQMDSYIPNIEKALGILATLRDDHPQKTQILEILMPLFVMQVNACFYCLNRSEKPFLGGHPFSHVLDKIREVFSEKNIDALIVFAKKWKLKKDGEPVQPF